MTVFTVTIPVGLCQCGCGRTTPVPQRTNLRMGQIAGEHQRFVTRHRKRRVPTFRFTIDPNSGCWLWAGSINNDGYGRIQMHGVHTPAHRALYRALGLLGPDDQCVDHGCRQKSCCNPLHLDGTTYTENNARITLTAEEHRALITARKNGHAPIVIQELALAA